jgi:hypothetical protein
LSDRVSVHISIGGKPPVSLVPALHSAIEQEGASGSWGGPPLARDPDGLRDVVAAVREPLWLCDDQHRGNFDTLEAFCIAHGLTFVSHSEVGDGFGAEMRWWTPALDAAHAEMALNGAPALTITEIRDLIDAPFPDQAVARLTARLAEATPPLVPPLELHASVPPLAAA